MKLGDLYTGVNEVMDFQKIHDDLEKQINYLRPRIWQFIRAGREDVHLIYGEVWSHIREINFYAARQLDALLGWGGHLSYNEWREAARIAIDEAHRSLQELRTLIS